MVKKRKGRSPQFPPNRERLSVDVTLDQLHKLFTSKWKIMETAYVLVDELAYVLQGYHVQGPEMKNGHIDVYVDPTFVPWPDKRERSIIPPKDSKYMEEWIDFMRKTGYGLDILRANPEFLELPVVQYTLLDGGNIHLMRAYEMTILFVEQTIMHYSLDDVGVDKIKEWLNKLVLIKDAAVKKGDQKLITLCVNKIEESQKKWKKLL